MLAVERIHARLWKTITGRVRSRGLHITFLDVPRAARPGSPATLAGIELPSEKLHCCVQDGAAAVFGAEHAKKAACAACATAAFCPA